VSELVLIAMLVVELVLISNTTLYLIRTMGQYQEETRSAMRRRVHANEPERKNSTSNTHSSKSESVLRPIDTTINMKKLPSLDVTTSRNLREWDEPSS
jgi:hypothetical protein